MHIKPVVGTANEAYTPSRVFYSSNISADDIFRGESHIKKSENLVGTSLASDDDFAITMLPSRGSICTSGVSVLLVIEQALFENAVLAKDDIVEDVAAVFGCQWYSPGVIVTDDRVWW